ncbi:MAG: RnfABCDGE type electron transport complex subunit G [PVC group bacterium]|nr:RnfABCDGE type electron transport complex subunit G [PVC group bacterium]
MLRLSGALLIVAMVCALTLALIYKQTAPVIEKQKQMLLERSLKAVLEADSYEKQEEKGLEYYEAYSRDGSQLGWCLPLTSKGYGGNMQLLVGVDNTGDITGVSVLEHKETPGLGSKIVEKSRKETEAPFLKQFKSKNAENLMLVKGKSSTNIQAITGATISSKAVTDGVREGVKEFLKAKRK